MKDIETTVQYDKSYKILLQMVLAANILYYVFELKTLFGVYQLMPMPMESVMGLMQRIPMVYAGLSLLLILNALFINLKHFTWIYLLVLLIEAILYLLLDHIITVGYSLGQTAWGVVVLTFYMMYVFNEPKGSRSN